MLYSGALLFIRSVHRTLTGANPSLPLRTLNPVPWPPQALSALFRSLCLCSGFQTRLCHIWVFCTVPSGACLSLLTAAAWVGIPLRFLSLRPELALPWPCHFALHCRRPPICCIHSWALASLGCFHCLGCCTYCALDHWPAGVIKLWFSPDLCSVPVCLTLERTSMLFSLVDDSIFHPHPAVQEVSICLHSLQH